MSSKLVLTAGVGVFGAGIGVMIAPLTLAQVFGMVCVGLGLAAYAWKEVK